jgi:hypothetical protein
MATKVFVSPGVYTTETELSFVAQSVGVTTLGIVGETLKGPAFEPIFVTNYDEFQTYFGTTSPEKFVNTQIPKYEAAYIAKAYLQQSNQLFVTRILGLSGYDAGPSWTITSIANLDSSSVFLGVDGAGSPLPFTLLFTANTTNSTVNFDFVTPPSNFSATTAYGAGGVNFTKEYTKFDGSTSSYQSDLESFLLDLVDGITTANSGNTIVWGPLSSDTYNTLSGVTNAFGLPEVSFSAVTITDTQNDPWYYAAFAPDNAGSNVYSGYSFYMRLNSINPVNGAGVLGGFQFRFGADTGVNADWNNLVLATLRSRGISEFNTTSDGPIYQVSGTSDASLSTTGIYLNAQSDPFATFGVSGTDKDGNAFSFESCLDDTKANFVSKVFGTGNFQKNRVDVPLFVEEFFPTLLSYGYNNNKIRGINNSFLTNEEARGGNLNSLANYLERYQTAVSPWIVSELRGNTVYQLFRYLTISDGNSSNREVKVSIANMSFENMTFDVLVRDYNDTDQNPVVFEKYTNCSMDPSQNNYVAKKIGTADGEYEILSKYIMLEVNEDAPSDALPCGFEGYLIRTYNSSVNPTQTEVFPIYKTKYNLPGDVISNPPFGLSTGNENSTISSGDNVRRTYLGFSSSVGWDANFFDYKGKQNPSQLSCTEQEYLDWSKQTKGFHMDSGATAVTISSVYVNSGETAFEVGITSFTTDPIESNNPYYRTYSRKFTVLPYGGFDGWDIYRERRTNGDQFVLGKSGYLFGAQVGCPPYTNATGWGAFRQITVEDNTSDYANTDYYAYKIGIETLNNPAIININVLATPGIDYVNNESLVRAAIDMVEIDRADSIYVTTTPDFDLLQPSTSMDNFIYPQDAVDTLADTGFDSNYTVTYYPWVLTRDSVFNTQIYIPPTAEVCRNLALTDNISFPWFATAGYTRGVVNSVRARRRLTQLDRDTLYQGRLNPIATFNDVGTVIWGNKTLQIRESPLDRINVRRLLLQARKLISAVAIRLLFEQNDAVVRQQFLDSVNPILDAIRRDRGITDFRVTVSNNPEDFDSNSMSGRIFLKPTKALEFIDIEFVITPQGASFENI